MKKNKNKEDELELKPEYIEKLERIRKEGNYFQFDSIEELRKQIEG